MLDIDISLLTMAKTIGMKSSAKASAAKPSGKPPTGDKTFGIEPVIRFYAIEDGDDTEKGEEPEILVVCDASLLASKKNLVKMQFLYINTFDHEGPIVIITMRNLTVGVFEHFDITSPTDVEKRLSYTQRILRGSELKNTERF